MKKLLFFLSFIISHVVLSQEKSPEFSLLLGLNQPIVLQGFNVEANYWTKKFVIDYSHGFGLKFRDNLVTQEARDQHLAFNITHTLGLGFGYRFTDGFNLRIEPKVHIWEMYYDDNFRSSSGRIKTYNTYTLGLGAYYRWLPFAKSEGALRGLTIAPSVRWWPNVATSLDNGEYNYYNDRTSRNEVHKANNIGVANTAWFANVSVGWTF
jgi:hypothetical protein